MSIIFDVETEGYQKEEILTSVPPFDPDHVKLGNRRDPASIMKYMESAEEEYYERFVERAALDARTGRVLCIGIRMPDDGEHYILTDDKEGTLLSKFWKLWSDEGALEDKRFLGFNILRFDLPFLLRRSWKLSIAVPATVWDGRYFSRNFIDLLNMWSLGNRDEMISLDHLARFLSLPAKDGTGAGFARLWHEDRPAAVRYLEYDLELVETIARKMSLL